MENCRKVYINCMIFSRVSNSFSSTLKQALDIPRCKALSAPLFEIGYQAIIFLCVSYLNIFTVYFTVVRKQTP